MHDYFQYIVYYWDGDVFFIVPQTYDTAQYFMGNGNPGDYYVEWIVYPNESFMLIPNEPGNWKCED